jgi:hypothetical protein
MYIHPAGKRYKKWPYACSTASFVLKLILKNSCIVPMEGLGLKFFKYWESLFGSGLPDGIFSNQKFLLG